MDDRQDTPTFHTPRNCKTCDRPDNAEDQMVQCCICKSWEHFGCAGVDDGVKQRSIKYCCKQCTALQGTSEGTLLRVPEGTRPAKGSKAGSRVSTKKGKKNIDPAKSTTSSVRAALLEEQLKLVAEEQ